MLESVKKQIKKIHENNKGSAIVLVIVALAMVGIFAMTIMWMSMTNFYMKATDKGNKQGFYSAETVLEQIKAGLEGDASWAASRAYAYVLTKDYSATSTADRDYEFKKEYQNYFVEKVADSSDLSKYDLSHLLEFVDTAAGVKLTRQTSGEIKYLNCSTPGSCKFIHSYSSNLMRLEGIHLEYTETDGKGGEYVTKIDTDIIIMVPDISFTQTSVLPDVFEYALVADKKLYNGKDPSVGALGTGSEVKGNIYAGDEGIELLTNLNIEDTGMVISKGDVKIGTHLMSFDNTELSISGITGTANTEFWANDITLGKGTRFTTNKVDTYVADDMTLMGRKSKVEMSGVGNYYGYGNSDEDADMSSSIVVNGIGSEVDMDALSKVLMLGRAFVSVPVQKIDTSGVTPVIIDSTEDFAMGESLAVKGDQVAFLIPDGCLFYREKTASANTIPMPNPFVKSMYPEDADHEIVADLAAVASYINTVSGDGYQIVKPYGSNLGYAYMKMTGDKANEYYKKYYTNNKEKLDNYFLVYAGNDKIEMPAGVNVSSAGDFLTAFKDDATVAADDDKLIQATKSQLYSANLEIGPDAGKATEINTDLTQKKNSLCAKLVKQGVTPTEMANDLFDNLILREDVKNLVALNTNPYPFEATSGDGNTYKAVFAKNDSGTPYNYNDASIRVLVVLGDVEINANFTGLLIASGTVRINGDYTIKSIINADDAQMQALKDTLQKKQSLEYLPTVSAGSIQRTEERSALQYFRDGSGYDLDGLQRGGTPTLSKNSVDFTELVKFNNWVKK